MTTMLTQSDRQLQHDVLAQLRYEPSIEASEIGVTARDGIVTLTGHVQSHLQKWKAGFVAAGVRGVRAVANEIEVTPDGPDEQSDEAIAATAAHTLKWNVFVPSDVKVSVSHGWVALDGEVRWQFQKTVAEDAIRTLDGIKGITNRIRVKPKVGPADLKSKIEEAFRRNAALDADRINVEAYDGHVILRGRVHSWSEHREAERQAWSAPGVSRVENLITVEP